MKPDADADLVLAFALVGTSFVEGIGDIGTGLEVTKIELVDDKLLWLVLLQPGMICFSEIIFMPSSTNGGSVILNVDPIGSTYCKLELWDVLSELEAT